MSTTVVLIVLASALIHASWNALLKAGGDKLLNTVMVAGGCGLIGAAALPFLPPPAPASWPYLSASAALQIVYFLLLAGAYRTGDMSQAYPVMRGAAPLLIAIASGPLIGEALPAARWAGIALISGGVLSLAFERTNLLLRQRAAVGFALANAGVICAYTMVDGIGVRISGSPAAYTLWIFILASTPLVAWALVFRGADFRQLLRQRYHIGLIGGLGTAGSYVLALWAMTLAPVAAVAALRETSIVFVLVISAVILKERLTTRRLVSALIIAVGAVAIRLS
jgi:drug/metabolite transporter (DMT)-like permease